MTSVIASWSSADVQSAGQKKRWWRVSKLLPQALVTREHFPLMQYEDGFQTELNESLPLQKSSRKHPLINRTLILLLITGFFHRCLKKKSNFQLSHMHSSQNS